MADFSNIRNLFNSSQITGTIEVDKYTGQKKIILPDLIDYLEKQKLEEMTWEIPFSEIPIQSIIKSIISLEKISNIDGLLNTASKLVHILSSGRLAIDYDKYITGTGRIRILSRIQGGGPKSVPIYETCEFDIESTKSKNVLLDLVEHTLNHYDHYMRKDE